MSLTPVLLVLLVAVTGLQACGGDGLYIYKSYEYHAKPHNEESYEVVHFEENRSPEILDGGPINKTHDTDGMKDPLTSNMWHHGWTPSPDEMKQWREWLHKFYTKYNETVINIMDTNKKNEYDEERGPGSGWPMRWADLGIGFPGTEPPPWAYAPKNVGRPRYCYLPPRIGVCAEGQTPLHAGLKFVYHPYKDECVPINYSGCGGNRNQFPTKTSCEKICVSVAAYNGCDPESHIYIDKETTFN